MVYKNMEELVAGKSHRMAAAAAAVDIVAKMKGSSNCCNCGTSKTDVVAGNFGNNLDNNTKRNKTDWDWASNKTTKAVAGNTMAAAEMMRRWALKRQPRPSPE